MKRAKWDTLKAAKYGAAFGFIYFVLRDIVPTFLSGPPTGNIGDWLRIAGGTIIAGFLMALVFAAISFLRNLFVRLFSKDQLG